MVSSSRGKIVKGPFCPDRLPAQNLNFRLRKFQVKQFSKSALTGHGSLFSAWMGFYVMARVWLPFHYGLLDHKGTLIRVLIGNFRVQ